MRKDMGSKIRVLSEQTINQIAAGEVIESPASVVKELVENSLDAGATHIQVEIVAGGFSLIKISDNGEGMSHDDALLSIERHATSKIRASEDLFSLETMGFRGEALASIASISKMHLLTCNHSELEATSLYVEGGKCLRVEKASRQRGTTLEMRALFFTTPARKKFQKNPAQAAADVHKVLIHVALSRPDVSFTFLSNQETLLHTVSETFEARVAAILGKNTFEQMIRFEKNMEWIQVKGLISMPGVDRPNRLGQYVFINKRPVIAPQISFALQDAYATMLAPRRFPLCVLDLALRPDLIDVNVHPQKKEIRFKDEIALKDFLREVVSQYLNQSSMQKLSMRPMEQLAHDFAFQKLQKTSYLDLHEPTQSLKAPEPLLFSMDIAPKVADITLIGIFKHFALIEPRSCLGLFACDYLPKTVDGFLMVDLQGISKRLYYEKAKAALDSTFVLEQLLFPLKFQVSPEEGVYLQQNLDLIQALGIKLSLFGKNIFLVEACDKSFNEEKVVDFLREFLQEPKTMASSLQAKKERLALKACKYLSCEKTKYTCEMAQHLLTKFMQAKLAFFTPDGKKIIGCIQEEIYAKGF